MSNDCGTEKTKCMLASIVSMQMKLYTSLDVSCVDSVSAHSRNQCSRVCGLPRI